MEFIFEIIYEVIIEGIFHLISDRNRARPWRIFFLTLLIAPPFALFYAFTFDDSTVKGINWITGLLMVILAAAWFLGVSWILRTGPIRENPRLTRGMSDQVPDPGSDND